MEYPISWVKVEKYAELTGDSVDAVQARRQIGKWLDGHHCKIVDGRLWIDLRAAQLWVEEWEQGSASLLNLQHLPDQKPKSKK